MVTQVVFRYFKLSLSVFHFPEYPGLTERTFNPIKAHLFIPKHRKQKFQLKSWSQHSPWFFYWASSVLWSWHKNTRLNLTRSISKQFLATIVYYPTTSSACWIKEPALVRVVNWKVSVLFFFSLVRALLVPLLLHATDSIWFRESCASCFFHNRPLLRASDEKSLERMEPTYQKSMGIVYGRRAAQV